MDFGMELNDSSDSSGSDDFQVVPTASSMHTETGELETTENTSVSQSPNSSGALENSSAVFSFIPEESPTASEPVAQCSQDALVPECNPSCSQSETKVLAPDITPDNVKIFLVNQPAWQQFHEHGNEMRITKQTSFMYPTLRVRIFGLQHEKMYNIYLEFPLRDSEIWKYVDDSWIGTPTDDSSTSVARIAHPNSPNYGWFWNSRQNDFLFNQLQLTCNPDYATKPNVVYLNHFRAYRIAVNAVELDDSLQPIEETKVKEIFQETDFMAVPQYKNKKIAELKTTFTPYGNQMEVIARNIEHLQQRLIDNSVLFESGS